MCIDFVSCKNLYFGYIELSESCAFFLCPYVFCVIKNGTTSPGVESLIAACSSGCGMQSHLHKFCRLHNLWFWSFNYFSKNRNLQIPWLVFVFTVTSILWEIDFLLNTHTHTHTFIHPNQESSIGLVWFWF